MKVEKKSNEKILDHSFTSAYSFMLMFKKASLCILTISAKQYNNYESAEWVQANSANEIFYLVAFVQYS
jgi:hypothetical protein